MQVNITRIDSRGRIAIPAHARALLGIKSGDSVALVANGKKEIAVSPSPGLDVVMVKVVMRNFRKGMKSFIAAASLHRMKLLSMESLTLEREEKFECTAKLQSGNNDTDAFRRDLLDANIDSVDIIR